MRSLLTACLLFAALFASAGEFRLRVEAPEHPGQAILLYRYDDLLTMRTIRMGRELPDTSGHVIFTGQVEGTRKLQLRIGELFSDIYVRPGSDLHITIQQPAPGMARSLNGTTRTNIVFNDMAPLDINALISDLNEKLDDFLMEDLATDRVAGMQVVEITKRGEELQDPTVQRPPTLFVMPDLSAERVDSLEKQLLHYYRGIEDPWFFHYLEFGVAGLKHGPRINERSLYERYLHKRPVHYDDPEQMRFIRGLFAEHITAYLHRYHEADLQQAMRARSWEKLKAVSARHDLLKEDDRLNELVLLDQLYMNHNSKLLVNSDTEALIAAAAASSTYPEHRTLASNMLWDLTTMRTGTALPAMQLVDPRGQSADLGELLDGPACLVFTAAWCTYCELEMAGLEKLYKEYKGIIPIVVISLDRNLEELDRYRKLHPAQDFIWLHAVDELAVREDLRIRSLPTVLLLNGKMLAQSPAPLPSTGLGAIFHRTKAAMDRDGRLKVWDE